MDTNFWHHNAGVHRRERREAYPFRRFICKHDSRDKTQEWHFGKVVFALELPRFGDLSSDWMTGVLSSARMLERDVVTKVGWDFHRDRNSFRLVALLSVFKERAQYREVEVNTVRGQKREVFFRVAAAN